MKASKQRLKQLVKEIVQRILTEGPVDRDNNYWVNSQGKVIGPFPHSHVGYILKIAIPKKQANLSASEIAYVKKLRGSEQAWTPMFKRGWIRLRKRKDNTEIDSNYDKTKVSARARKALIDWIFNNMKKNTRIIYVNDTPYTKEQFFDQF